MTRLSLQGDRFYLRADYEEREKCKTIPGYKFDDKRKCWRYPATPSALREIIGKFPHVEIDDTAQAMVESLKAAAQAVRVAKDAGWEKAQPLVPIPVKLPNDWEVMQHQVLGFNIGIQIPNIALLMEMGTGKTLTAIGIAGRRILDGYARRILVVAPMSVVPVWPAELAQFADFPFKVEVFEGEAAKRNRKFRRDAFARFFNETTDQDARILVTNYESIANTYMELAKWNPDIIIADESQRIKNHRAGRSKAMHYLGDRARYKMILTGTPITQGPLDYFSQYRFLEPTVFGNSFTTFRSQYADMGGFEDREVVKFKHVEDLERRANSIAFRVRAEDCLDLPKFVPVYRTCELEPKARKIYDALVADAVAEIEGSIDANGELSQVTINNILVKIMRCQQIAGGFLTDDDGVVHVVSQAKMKLMEDQLALCLENGQKVVIFARFRAEITAIQEHLTKLKIKHNMIWGDTPRGEIKHPVTKELINPRRDEVANFQSDPESKVFLAQIQTAGLGITLTSACVNMFYSYNHSFGDYDQARKRTDRIGQINPGLNLHLMANETSDVDVLKALRRKRNVADCIVDGKWRDLLRGSSVDVSDFDFEFDESA